MRKGVSPIIATVLLITITIIIAFIIFSFGNEFITQLSPAPNCEGVVFEAGIYETAEGYKLDVNNLGNENIEGFSLIIENEREGKTDLKSIPTYLKAGESTSEKINFEYNILGKEVKIVPSIKNAQDKVVACELSRDAQIIQVIQLNSISPTD